MVKVLKNYEASYMEWKDVLTLTYVRRMSGKVYTEYTPVGADNILVNPDGTYTISVVDLRVLLDNLRDSGESFEKIKLVPAHYLDDVQGYNSIVLYRGWFCRVDSCGIVILCTEQEAYDRGLLAR